MMTRPDMNKTSITVNEIKDFFFNSWVYACKHLAYQLNKSKPEYQQRGIVVPTIKQFEQWAMIYERDVKNSIEEDLRESGIMVDLPISLQDFTRWVYKDHSIVLRFDQKIVRISTSLANLEEVGFDYAMPGQQMAPMGNLPNYQGPIGGNLNQMGNMGGNQYYQNPVQNNQMGGGYPSI